MSHGGSVKPGDFAAPSAICLYFYELSKSAAAGALLSQYIDATHGEAEIVVRHSRVSGRGATLIVVLAVLGATGATKSPTPAPSPTPSVPPSPQPSFVPVHIAGIRATGPDQVLLLLADESEQRAVPIAIGRDQGIAIYLGKMKAETTRPLTHDLIATILGLVGAVIERITVTELKNDVYYAEIALRAAGKVHPIDARPSDAIALAVRLDTPIFSAPALLKPIGGPGSPESTLHADRELGLTVQELDPDLAQSLGAADVAGVLVASVARGGPADRAGVRRGDIVQGLDGHPVAGLSAYLQATGPRVRSFTVWRDGRTTTLGGA